ncbi:apolipoprotein N-acyltransferase [Thermodesulfobacteriota bacterium]
MLFVSSVLLVASFENINLDFCVWFSFIPFFFVVKNKAKKGAFLAGLFFGLLFNLMAIYWLVYTISFYGAINVVLSFFIFLLLVAYLALYFGLFAWLYKIIIKRFDSVFVAPIIFVALEYLRTYMLSGFPWILLGYSLYKRPILTQFSDITGVYGQTFLIVLINSMFFRIIKYFKSERKKKYIFEAAGTILILVAVVIYGTFTLKSDIEVGDELSVALIQGNIPQAQKWDKKFKRQTIDIYSELTMQAVDEIALDKGAELSEPALVVWPETASPFYMQSSTKYRDELIKLAESSGSYLLTGGLSFKPSDEEIEEYKLLNSAFLISPEKKIIGRYDKVHLVPFGEYVPMPTVLFFVNKITDGVGDFSSGGEAKNLTMGEGGLELGVLICYESIFPDLVRQFTDKGADLLINITNDAWFGDTSAPHQQVSMAAFRAVENKRYLIRAANTGVSMVVDPFGRVIKKTGTYEDGFITGKIRPVKKRTFYAEHGDLFAQVVSVTLFLLLVLSYLKRAAYFLAVRFL